MRNVKYRMRNAECGILNLQIGPSTGSGTLANLEI